MDNCVYIISIKIRHGLYNKINREQVNGETDDFSEEELALFKGALVDLSTRIRNVADSL